MNDISVLWRFSIYLIMQMIILFIRNTVNLVISTLKKDAENAMVWFTESFMQANPTKFQCMLMKRYTCKEIILDSIEIHGTTIMKQTEVNIPRICHSKLISLRKSTQDVKNQARKVTFALHTYKCKW